MKSPFIILNSRLLNLILILSISISSYSNTITLKPGPSAGKDVYLDQNTSTTNYGSHLELAATSWTCSPQCNVRGLLQFDLSSLPVGSIITNARLSLFAASTPLISLPGFQPMNGNNQSILQRVTSSWNENTVTWNTTPTATTQNQVILSQSVSPVQNYLNIDVKNIVQDMINNPASSFGFLLRLSTEVPSKTMIFASSDNLFPSLWPEITIEYNLPIATLPLSRDFYCIGSPISVSYNIAVGTYNANNVFTAQLSSSNGSFNSPVNIGSVNSINSGNISASIPTNLPYGNGYRIRVISSNPAGVGSDNGSNISFLDPSDGNVCTSDFCDLPTGIIFHTNINTSDDNSCTDDGCNSLTGVFHSNIDISDNNACTSDGCNTLSGVISHILINSNDNNVCTIDACNSSTGIITHDLISFNDNNACSIDICDPVFGIFHISIAIDDNNVCTTDACNTLSGSITHTGISADDNNACTTDECDPLNGVFHNPVNINDNNQCTFDACDASSGIISHTDVNINDNNACTVDACNSATGNISHNILITDDKDACTFDGCDFITGIFHNPVNSNDNNACTIDACDPLTGNISHTLLVTDDNDACTFDDCNPLTGLISHIIININDNNECTTDGCDALTGVFHNTINKDDNNECTFDVCDPVSGVFHFPLNTDDGNVCTQDGCNPVTGTITHTAISFDDNNICTDDVCNPLSGVFHTLANIDDNNPCTIDACDPQTGISHIDINIDDNNPCTIDACNSLTGAITHLDESPSIEINSDNILCYGGTTCITVTATGGLPPYSGSGTFCGYNAGSYVFEIIDSKGCLTFSTPVIIDQPSKLNISASSTPAGCNTNDGTAIVVESGGISPYVCIWTPGGQIAHTAVNLASGNYLVTCTDANGCTATASVFVGSSGSSVSAPGSISGPGGTCRGQGGVIYSIAPIPGAVSYLWTLPSGASGSSTSNSISVNFNSKFLGGYMCVKAVSTCGMSTSTCINILLIDKKPNTPGKITRPDYLCPLTSATFSIAPVPKATSYNWTAGAGLNILSGQGTNSIVVSALPGFISSTLKVYASNCKGISGTKTIEITGLPAQPGSITGNNSVCKTQTKAYSISPLLNASTYNWTISGGGVISSGQGTPNVNVDFSFATISSLALSVTADNSCGSSLPKTKNISVNLNCKLFSAESEDNNNFLSSVSVYPNPTSGKLNIFFGSDLKTQVSLKVIDVLGNVVFNNSILALIHTNQKEIDLSSLTKGIYMLILENQEHEIKNIRVVVE